MTSSLKASYVPINTGKENVMAQIATDLLKEASIKTVLIVISSLNSLDKMREVTELRDG